MKRFEEMYGIDSLSIRSSDEASQLLFLMKKDSNKMLFSQTRWNHFSILYHPHFILNLKSQLFLSQIPRPHPSQDLILKIHIFCTTRDLTKNNFPEQAFT